MIVYCFSISIADRILLTFSADIPLAFEVMMFRILFSFEVLSIVWKLSFSMEVSPFRFCAGLMERQGYLCLFFLSSSFMR